MDVIDFLKSRNFKVKKQTENIYKFFSKEKKYEGFFVDFSDLTDKYGLFELTIEKNKLKELGWSGQELIFFHIGGKFYYCDLIENYYLINIKKEFNLLGESVKEKQDYIPLNNTFFGLCKGQEKKNLIDFLKINNFEACGICDDNLSGILDFYISCKDNGIKPIIGREFIVKDYGRLSLYAKDYNGFKNLMYINYIESFIFMKFSREMELKDFKILKKRLKGILVIQSFFENKNKFINLFKRKKYGDICKEVSKVEQLFEQYYISVEYSDYEDNEKNKIRDILLNGLFKIKEELKVKYVFYNRFVAVDRDGYEAYKVLRKVGGDEETIINKYYKYGCLMKGENINKCFGNYSIDIFDVEILKRNTQEIANLCNLEISIGQYDLPHYDYKGDKKEFFVKLAKDGFEKKFSHLKGEERKLYKERLEKELKVIVDAGFIDYMLIVYDIINWAKENGIPVGVARGSVAGCLIAYLIGITGVDPIRFGLLFERFLNETRAGASIYKIKLENGEEIKLSGGKNVKLKNGGEISVSNLKEGEEVLI